MFKYGSDIVIFLFKFENFGSSVKGGLERDGFEVERNKREIILVQERDRKLVVLLIVIIVIVSYFQEEVYGIIQVKLGEYEQKCLFK